MKVTINKADQLINELGPAEPVRDPRPSTDEEGFLSAQEEDALERENEEIIAKADLVVQELTEDEGYESVAAFLQDYKADSPEEFMRMQREALGPFEFHERYYIDDYIYLEETINISHTQLNDIIQEEIKEATKFSPEKAVYTTDDGEKKDTRRVHQSRLTNIRREDLSNQIKQRRMERQRLKEEALADIQDLASRMRGDIEKLAKEAGITPEALLALIGKELTQ